MSICPNCGKSFVVPKKNKNQKYCSRACYEEVYFVDQSATSKRCSKCNLIKSLDEFSAKRNARDGKRSQCKACQAKEAVAYRKKHLEEMNKNHAVYRIEHCEEIGEYNAQYRAEHKQERAEYNAIYYATHREEHDAYTVEWYKKHPGESGVKARRRRAKKRDLTHAFDDANWQHALEYFNHHCAVCVRPRGLWHTLAQDHWIPLSDPRPENPGTVPWNIVPLCHGVDGCNNFKGNRDPVEWLIDRFGERKAKQILKRIQNYFDWVKKQED